MAEELISIIMPVYNVSKYVEHSIKSLMNQTYHNLEILVVDDGSTDNSYEICKSLEKEDSRIDVFRKKNGGQGSARNMALDKAHGQYICFLDSDDFVEVDYIEYLYTLLKLNDLDISVCNYKLYDENEKFIRTRTVGEGYIELNGIDAIKSMWTQGVVNIGPWCKLYRSYLWEGIKFEECFGEDLATMHLIYERAGKVGYSYEAKLNYRVRNESSIRKFQENKLDLIQIVTDNLNFAIKYPKLVPAAKQKAASVYFHVLFQLPDVFEYSDVRKKIKNKIRKIRWDVLTDKECIRKTRIALILSYFGFNLTQKVFNTVRRNDITF